MLEVLGPLAERLTDRARPQACAVATVVGSSGSVPRGVGASMLVSESGEVIGSLTGGCVEGAVVEVCGEALATGAPDRHHYGYSDTDAFAVGLMCGGAVEVLVEPCFPPGRKHRPLLDPAVLARVAGDPKAPAAVVHVLTDDDVRVLLVEDPGEVSVDGLRRPLAALLPDSAAADSAAARVSAMLRGGRTGTARLSPERDECAQPISLFVQTRMPPPRLLVFGANAFSAALVEAAAPLGYSVTLCDARTVFATRAAFPGVDELVHEWPHRWLERAAGAGEVDERTVVCVLTHDPKFDIPLLRVALGLDVAYVGAMGSRRSDRQRRERLRSAGVGADALARLRSPVGLDLGAVTPQEVAVSILAEIVADRSGRAGGRPLSASGTPIHGQRLPAGSP